MAKRPKKPRHPMQLAKLIGDIATGERPNDSPRPELEAEETAWRRKGRRKGAKAVEGAFGSEIDYAMLIKMYEGDSGKVPTEARYSPAQCLGTRMVCIAGNPDPYHVSTSFAERRNLSMRMGMRRFTRLTNALSKKVDNHKAAVALYSMNYNFAPIHKTLRVTPAMEVGVADHVWSLAEIARLAA